jgi:DNA-binding IclR family transcriptional regulator
MRLIASTSPDTTAFQDSEVDTPALRLFALLEMVADRDQWFSLHDLTEISGWPKPTVHRMLGQLERAGLVQRESEGRHYGIAPRLRRLARNLVMNDTLGAARHRVLRGLVQDLGESCNLTTLVDGEVMYLDRVETAAPLRFYLQPGSRVPVHCSATGKLFLAQMSAGQRRRLLADAPLERFTDKTITQTEALEKEIDRVRSQGYALDNEEFLPGLVCLAVLVPNAAGKSHLGIAVQAPVMRLNAERALQCLPRLNLAAQALARIEREGAARTSEPLGEQQA